VTRTPGFATEPTERAAPPAVLWRVVTGAIRAWCSIVTGRICNSTFHMDLTSPAAPRDAAFVFGRPSNERRGAIGTRA